MKRSAIVLFVVVSGFSMMAAAQNLVEMCMAQCVQQAQLCKSYCKGAQCNNCALAESSCPQRCQMMPGAQPGVSGSAAAPGMPEIKKRAAKLSVTMQVRQKLTGSDIHTAGNTGPDVDWEELRLDGAFDLEVPDIDYVSLGKDVRMGFSARHVESRNVMSPSSVDYKGAHNVPLPAPRVVSARGKLTYASKVTHKSGAGAGACSAVVRAEGAADLAPDNLAELAFRSLKAGETPGVLIQTSLEKIPLRAKVEGNCGSRVTAPTTGKFLVYATSGGDFLGDARTIRRTGQGLEGTAIILRESGAGYEEEGKLSFRLDL